MPSRRSTAPAVPVGPAGRGAASFEYLLLALGIAVVVVAALLLLRAHVRGPL